MMKRLLAMLFFVAAYARADGDAQCVTCYFARINQYYGQHSVVISNNSDRDMIVRVKVALNGPYGTQRGSVRHFVQAGKQRVFHFAQATKWVCSTTQQDPDKPRKGKKLFKINVLNYIGGTIRYSKIVKVKACEPAYLKTHDKTLLHCCMKHDKKLANAQHIVINTTEA